MIFPQRMIDASPDVGDHEGLRFLPVAIECALKQRLIFSRGDFAAEHHDAVKRRLIYPTGKSSSATAPHKTGVSAATVKHRR